MTQITATQITAAVVEMTARRDGVVFVAGVRVAAADLPALTGSPKQVAWAEKIRAAAIERLGTELGEIVAKRIPTSMVKEDAPEWAAVCAQLESVGPRFAGKFATLTAAAWWIDNRDALSVNAGPTIGRAAV